MTQTERVTLITGGTEGMGLMTAELLARAGHRVVICGRRAQAGAAALAHLAQSGLEAAFIACDVADTQSVCDLVEQVVARYGRLDYAFNNAGVTVPVAAIAQSDPEQFRRVVEINLMGVYNCLRAQIPAMIASGGGAIVNTSSLAGIAAIPGQAAYVASKFGVIGLSQAAAIEYAGEPSVRVNVVAPGPILGGMNTEQALAANPERTKRKIGVTAMKRFGTQNEVAQTVAWLLSDAASYITGAVIPIDGGASAGKF